MKLMRWAMALAAMGMVPTVASAATSAPATTAEQSAAAAQTPAADAPAETAATVSPFEMSAPEPNFGIPDGRKGLQEQVTELGQRAAAFHDNWLLVMCALISLFVLALLAWTIIRYRRSASPTPSRTSHNTMIEVVWTLIPVLILVAITIPSIRLIRAQYSPPPADLTIKVIGHQWYWTYEYPDNGGFAVDSNMLKEADDPTRAQNAAARTDRDGPPLLAVDERLVIPAGKVVKFLVTSDDVIHSFAVPAFWTKMDANPGRINETWVKVDRPGVYFGQCSELCGARHGYMPIAVEVMPEARFNAWLASKGGSPKGAKPVVTPAAQIAATEAAAAAEQPAIERPGVSQVPTAQD